MWINVAHLRHGRKLFPWQAAHDAQATESRVWLRIGMDRAINWQKTDSNWKVLHISTWWSRNNFTPMPRSWPLVLLANNSQNVIGPLRFFFWNSRLLWGSSRVSTRRPKVAKYFMAQSSLSHYEIPSGYGSIPINTILMGWTSINPSYDLGFTRGTRVLTHPHLSFCHIFSVDVWMWGWFTPCTPLRATSMQPLQRLDPWAAVMPGASSSEAPWCWAAEGWMITGPLEWGNWWEFMMNQEMWRSII